MIGSATASMVVGNAATATQTAVMAPRWADVLMADNPEQAAAVLQQMPDKKLAGLPTTAMRFALMRSSIPLALLEEEDWYEAPKASVVRFMNGPVLERLRLKTGWDLQHNSFGIRVPRTVLGYWDEVRESWGKVLQTMDNPKHYPGVFSFTHGFWTARDAQDPQVMFELASAMNAIGIPLFFVDWSGVSFRKTDLSGFDFSRAFLRGADLSRANFVGARLCAADLSGALVRNTDFSGADLTAACLDDLRLATRRRSVLTFLISGGILAAVPALTVGILGENPFQWIWPWVAVEALAFVGGGAVGHGFWSDSEIAAPNFYGAEIKKITGNRSDVLHMRPKPYDWLTSRS